MMFPGWQIGLDIQSEGVRAVAIQWHRQGWQLRQWWHLLFERPVFTDNILSRPDDLLKVLEGWRKQLPNRHQLRVSFPAQRTIQRKIPAADSKLCESMHENYIAYTAAQQLQMPASQLCCDYFEQHHILDVTAARQSDIDTLLNCLKSVQLFPHAVTPCDKVLCTLPAECYPADCHYLVHEEAEYWLWAGYSGDTRSGWQDKRQTPCLAALCLHLNTCADNIALSRAWPDETHLTTVKTLDIWSLLSRQYPPLPQQKGRYTIALGLALGGAC